MKTHRWLCFPLFCSWLSATASGEVTREQVERLLDSNVHEWRWKLGESRGAEKPEFDDLKWEHVDIGFRWWPHDSAGWFRTRIKIPETINGIPLKGGEVRMKAGVDNGARAFVNGAFKQEFEWSKGDFILTEHSQPGQVITVAFHATNRPGSGGLLEARLVNTAAEPLVETLRAFAKDLDAAVEDASYVPAAEIQHWRRLTRDALQSLDLSAYSAGNRDAFLVSVEQARAVLFSDRATVEERLNQTATNLMILKQIIRERREAGLSTAYATADARVVESFLLYARDDLAESNPGHQLRGLKAAAYIDRLGKDALKPDAADNRVVPRYKTGPAKIHDGAFWQNERPVFFTGVGHFGQVRQDIPILNDYGLNIIQIEMGPANGLPTPDNVDLEAIRQNVVRWLDLAAAHNVAVNLLISPHYFPQWAFDADPAHKQCGHGFIKFCIEAPNTRNVMEKWLDVLMPMIAKHPALHSICLSNEPQYKGRCAYDRAAFQTWLKTKWRSIKRANAAYGTRFRNFEGIELPTDDSNYGLYFDRWRFNQARFVAFHEMLRDRIHRYAPKLPVHSKVMSHAFEDPGRFEVGIDYERFPQLGRIAGNDCVVEFTGERKGDYACDWQTMAMNYTLQHSVAPDAPIFNSENHLIADGDTRYIPENYVRTVFWQEAIHGQGATTTWVWERGQSGDLAENILTRASCVHAFGRVALDLQRLAPEVYALSRAPADAAILYAYSSLLPSKDYADEARAAFEGSYFSGITTDFITERQIMSGKLARYKLLIVPHASHSPDAVVKAVNEFIGKGGIVLATGRCFTKDEYGRPRAHGLVQSGRGHLVTRANQMSPLDYREVINRLAEEAMIRRPLRIEGDDDKPVWGVNLRTTMANGRLLANLLNLSRKPQVLRLTTKRGVKRVLNLVDGREQVTPFTLSPLDPKLLAVEQW